MRCVINGGMIPLDIGDCALHNDRQREHVKGMCAVNGRLVEDVLLALRCALSHAVVQQLQLPNQVSLSCNIYCILGMCQYITMLGMCQHITLYAACANILLYIGHVPIIAVHNSRAHT